MRKGVIVKSMKIFFHAIVYKMGGSESTQKNPEPTGSWLTAPNLFGSKTKEPEKKVAAEEAKAVTTEAVKGGRKRSRKRKNKKKKGGKSRRSHKTKIVYRQGG